MPDLFPSTHATWLIERVQHAPDEARAHIMSRYHEPLCAYVRASSLRTLGEQHELVNDFLASRVADAGYLVRWSISGMPLRRWLVNGLITHARNRAQAEARRRSARVEIDPTVIAESLEPTALLALERAWAMRVMIEAHDRVRSEFDADGKSAWWELFRLHSVQGLGYAQAAAATGVPIGSASHINRVVATRLREVLRALLERDGVPPDEIERELALMQDLLE
jgi:DNA-directed RNA polymerase specialized sigma24 family protein